MTPVSWSAARSQVLMDSGSFNLNCGSFGLVPKVVWDECQRLRLELASQPMNFFLRITPELLLIARKSLASHISCNYKSLAFSSNVTTAVNLVANSCKLAPGDVILTTDLEYGAMRWTWERIAQKAGCFIKCVEVPHLAGNPDEIVSFFKPYFQPPVKIFFFSHVTSPTGLVLPARELCRLAKERGILTIVDGAHGVGTLEVSIMDMQADFYGGNLHKWLGAPTGSGFFTFNPELSKALEPLIVSWGYHHPPGVGPDDDDGMGTTAAIRKLEFVGTTDPCPWLVTPKAVEFQNNLGFRQIRARQRELVQYARERLSAISWLELATPKSSETSCAMVAFRVRLPMDLDTLRQFLWKHHKVEVGLNQHSRLGLLLRVSCHFFTMESEIDHLFSALDALERRVN